jgi:hypothetical protein
VSLGGTWTYTADIFVDWAGPAASASGGTWTATEKASSAGASATADGGTWTFTQQVTIDWPGPVATANAGSWSWLLTGDSYDGTQYVDGALAIEGPTTIVLDPGIYPVGGNYVLFQYGSFPTPAQLSNLIIDATQLPLCFVEVVQDKPHKSHVVMRLKSGAPGVVYPTQPTPTTLTIGKQFVDGALAFNGPTTLYLDGELYATDGTYQLFEATGGVTGVANLTVVSEAGLFCGAPFLDGNIVKVTLV